MGYIFLVLPKYHIISFSTALQKLQKIVTCFSEDKLSSIFPDLQIQKVFMPWLLMHVCFLLEHQWVFESSVIAANESLSRPRCEKMDLKIIQPMLERVQIHIYAGKPKNLWELNDFSEEQKFNCSGQTRDSWTTITKQKKQLWIIQVTTHY